MMLKDCYSDFLAYKKKQGHADHTLGEYRHFMDGTFAHCVIKDKSIEDLRLTDVADIIDAGKVHGEFGAQRSVSLFRQILRFLDERGDRIPFNWMLIKLPHVSEKEQDFFTPLEFENFIALININTLYGLRDRALY
ncbi:MAG: hypothetical protein WCX69_04640, partial [Candidatus Paceibacterota bacterium]